MVLLPGAYPTTLSHIEPASLVAAQRGVRTTSWTPPLDIAAAASRTPPPQAAPAPPPQAAPAPLPAAARSPAASREASGVTLEEQLRLQQFARDAERTLGSSARQESTAHAPSP